MSIVVGVPFQGGLVVAADRAGLYRDKDKLYVAGNRLFSATNDVEVITRDGRVVFSVDYLVMRSTPARVELSDLPKVAEAVSDLARRQFWPVTQPKQEALVVFWFPRAYAAFKLENNSGTISHSSVTTYQINPDRHRPYILQGMDEWVEQHVIQPGRLTPASCALMRKPFRSVSVEEATALARDVVLSAERTMAIVTSPWKIGGGCDVRVVGQQGVTVVELPASERTS